MTAYSFDHLAIAAPDWSPAGPWLASVLGGRWGHGARMPHMDVCQLHFGNDTRLELLSPGSSPDSFVRRFLEQAGGRPRPHHLTFKVTDIKRTLDAAVEHGIEPILVNLEHDVWKEAFLHPRDTGLGFLVQFVESAIDPTTVESDAHVPAPWSDRVDGRPADVDFVLARVPGLTTQRPVLRDILGGREEELDAPGGRRIVRFSWSRGADVILVTGTDPADGFGVRSIGVRPGESLDLPLSPLGPGYRETGRLDLLGLSLIVSP
ncbi:Glyoxalase/Bleomycin resistance protein/Dioxygenase superfamily protein [Thermomonospora echinospora]|uniref:Glyoxalase/Bleomycin resistance protein/Dioxygenase superfamily protein n=1 Tax=Thermomonospora echinospora TaxID=1992 RepID=A0A1H6E6W8_9ACTN|nr:VOC family protein [Thermomonospora echinospora]SEG93558.1 Glyoxalase/Bleomycin resistance protein/Dioxygenase superfamily protein [Thermomonospora echinospora]